MRIFITAEQAMKLLADGDAVHTFRQGGMMLVGTDWDRADIEKLMTGLPSEQIELSGETARRMKHGVCVWDRNENPLFVETDPDRLDCFRSEICDIENSAKRSKEI